MISRPLSGVRVPIDFRSITPVALSLLCLVFSLLDPFPRSAAAADEEEERIYSSSTHGFAIERPDESWTVKETENPADGLFTFVMEPSDADTGMVQVTVRVKPLDQEATAKAVRDNLLETTVNKPEYTRKEKKPYKIAGRTAPGMVVEMKAYGRDFRINLAYLVEAGRIYNIQCHAPAAEFAKRAKVFKKIFASFRFIEIKEDDSPERRIRKMAARCGSEIAWVATWDEAAALARKEKKLVLVVFRSLSGFEISDAASSGPFMDPDIVALLEERFVAYRFSKGMEAPFVPQGSSYGIGPLSFGTTFLLATPEGEIVGDTFSAETTAFHDFLVEHLARNPEFRGPPRPGGLKGLDLAEFYLRRGDLDKAAKLLDEPDSARGLRLEASLLRRLKKGDEALTRLEKARQADGGEEAAAAIALDEAVLLARMGKPEKALKRIEPFPAEHKDSALFPEALFWIGALNLRLEGKEKAEEVWTALVLSHPENRWAWKAAASLESTTFKLGLSERLAWPPEEILAVLGPHEFEKGKAPRLEQAANDAIAFLLRTQRPDGSWICPSEVGLPDSGEGSPFTAAITAICGQSLLSFHEKAGCAEAVDRAVDYILAAWEKYQSREKKVYFMDYTVYTMSYALRFFSAGIEAGWIEREKVAVAMSGFVEEIRSKQRSGGGWSYLMTLDLDKADRPINQSISFITAVALIALIETREAGIEVPEKMIAEATGCLERMRNDDGTFEYMLYHDREGGPRNTAVPGAAGRGPFCAHVLLRAGRGDVEFIRKTLDHFMEYRHTYAREHGKTLMHAGLHGQGSHYLMFDYANTAAAIRTLPKKERKKYGKPLLDQVLGARTEDGGYIDNPMIGPHYGAGMALIAFRHLESDR